MVESSKGQVGLGKSMTLPELRKKLSPEFSNYLSDLTIRELEGICITPHTSCAICWQESTCSTDDWAVLFFDIKDNPDKYWNKLNDTVNN